MSPAELAAYCAAPSTLSVAGTVVLMVIACFVGRIVATALSGRVRGVRIELPPSVLMVCILAVASVAVMVLLRLVEVVRALMAACSGTLAETTLLTLLFVVAALTGIRGATLLVSRLFAEFERPAPEPTRTTTEPTVPATTIYAQLGDVLQTLARAHGYNVGRNEVYDLIPDRQLFRALPAAEAEMLVLRLATDILNAEAIRIGSQRRTSPAEVRKLTYVKVAR